MRRVDRTLSKIFFSNPIVLWSSNNHKTHRSAGPSSLLSLPSFRALRRFCSQEDSLSSPRPVLCQWTLGHWLPGRWGRGGEVLLKYTTDVFYLYLKISTENYLSLFLLTTGCFFLSLHTSCTCFVVGWTWGRRLCRDHGFSPLPWKSGELCFPSQKRQWAPSLNLCLAGSMAGALRPVSVSWRLCLWCPFSLHLSLCSSHKSTQFSHRSSKKQKQMLSSLFTSLWLFVVEKNENKIKVTMAKITLGKIIL